MFPVRTGMNRTKDEEWWGTDDVPRTHGDEPS